MSRRFNHTIIDNFLSRELRNSLYDYAQLRQEHFKPATTQSTTGPVVSAHRNALYLDGSLGPLKGPFKDAIRSRFQDILSSLKMTPFELGPMEVEMAYHGDGCYFRRHIDTIVGDARKPELGKRLVSTVYYFHTHPKAFAGGELSFFPIGPGDPIDVEPADNRLVAFTSIAPHEVKEVRSRDNPFSHGRFSVNCWLHRSQAELDLVTGASS